MQYLLVQNRQSIMFGPVFWQPRFIKSVLADADIEYTPSPIAPESRISINETIEIFPIAELIQPSHDPVYEQLAGPWWTYNDTSALGHYTVVERDLTAIKSTLLEQTAATRWSRETAGIKYTINGVEVSVATDRESRNIWTQKILSLGDDVAVQWKFPQGWVIVTKADLIALLGAIDTHVQAQYDWEAGIVAQISAAQTVTELQEIVIIEAAQGELV